MKNKRGFTLIELLAVIVILAIIALIAVPIVLNMITQARRSAARSAALGYVDAIEYNNGFSNADMDGYTLITGTKNVSEINVKMKGKKPTNGTVTVDSNGKVTSATLCINNYTVVYENNDVTSVTSGCSNNQSSTPEPSQPSVPAPVSFSTDSWATIAANTTSNVYEVGQEKTITMDVNGDNTDETYHIMIVNKTECTTEESESACGLVLQFKEPLNITNADDKKMNLTATNAGGWPGSKMYTYLNETIYNKLPSELKSVIIPTKTVSGHESGVTDNYVSNNDKLYLLSTKEVGFGLNSNGTISNGTDSARDETRKLDYYDFGEGDEAKAKRIKYNYGTETANYWWLRSASISSTISFYSVLPGGSTDITIANYTYGVSPAFRVGTN